MFIAVQTSDIVHSTNMSQRQHAQLIAELKTLLDEHDMLFSAQHEVYRGDAFQVCYTKPNEGLKAALLIKLRLLSFDEHNPVKLTQSLCFGHQTSLDKPISQSMGEVFVQSGRVLDKTSRGQIAITLADIQTSTNISNTSTFNHSMAQSVSLITAFLNNHLTGLTQKQAQVIYHYLNENFPEQQFIADRLQMTRQNVATHLKRGGADLFKQSIEFFEQYCKDASQ
ncbi:hypothetical protein PN836_002765 [Ningiella sp. W23]|uniref:hypothetical protein n=1 Tax=Ningiella sp. W23 TaxID=3023715 RepID=UPI003756F47E